MSDESEQKTKSDVTESDVMRSSTEPVVLEKLIRFGVGHKLVIWDIASSTEQQENNLTLQLFGRRFASDPLCGLAR